MSTPKTPASPTPASTAEAPPEAKFEWTHSPFEAFLERHFKALLAVLCLVALGVGAWLVWQQKKEEKLVREGEAFAGAETLDDYKKVIANHPGSTAAGSAQFMIANLLAQNNDTAGALEELQKFKSTYAAHPLVDQAAFRIAVLSIDKGEIKPGLEKLEAFINEFPKSPLRGQALLRRADALAATGERDKAAEIYQAMLTDTTLAGNPVRTDAENRLAKVKLKPPTEVEFVPEPTPAPPVDPAAPAPTFSPAPGVPPLNIKAPSGPFDIKAPSLLDPLVPSVEPPVLPEVPLPSATPPAAPPPAEPPPRSTDAK